MDKRRVVQIGSAVATGLGTFLILGAGQPDRGDEFIYGLVVGAIVYWLAGKALSPRKIS